MNGTHFGKRIVLLVLIGLVACASRPSLEELEQEAIKTGDWSAVEERKRMDRKMGRYDPELECPTGEALLCEKKGQREMCECVSSHTLLHR